MGEMQLDMSAQTGLLGVFGHPIGHSLSPRIHNAAFRAQGLDLVYLAFDVAPERLPAAVSGIRALGIRGVNLTVPHKEAALPLLDALDTLAERVGAANTIVNDDGLLTGYNTDISGFTAALATVLPQGVRGLDCLVVGAGGAARAVLAALTDGGARTVYVYNRTPGRAVDLCRVAGTWGESECRTIDEAALQHTARSVPLIVNATPAGLSGGVKELPLPVDSVGNGQIVVDLAYGRKSTTLVEAARQKGAIAIDGKKMLVMQAALAYRLWTGLEPPIETMHGSIDLRER